MEKEYKFSISEVSSKTGISTSAINYYIRSNLITPPKKTAKTRAFFSQNTIDELFEVKELKSKGLPMKMIKQSLDKNKKIPKYTSFTGSIKKLSEELISSFSKFCVIRVGVDILQRNSYIIVASRELVFFKI